MRAVFPRTGCDRESRTVLRCALSRCQPYVARSGPLRGLARETEAIVRRRVVTEIGIAGYFATACESLNR